MESDPQGDDRDLPAPASSSLLSLVRPSRLPPILSAPDDESRPEPPRQTRFLKNEINFEVGCLALGCQALE